MIPNEEYSESSETFNDTRENIFTYEQCSEITGHHIKRKEEEQKKMCTNFIGSCLHYRHIKFECKEDKKTSVFTLKKISPKAIAPQHCSNS